MAISVYRNFSQIATLHKAYEKDGRMLVPEDLSLIANGSIVFDESQILWIGKDEELPEEFQNYSSKDFSGHTLTPELVDCHTHLIFGGDRAEEYSMRLNGADYEAIARAGGGILSTMRGTNQASKEELFQIAKERIETIASYGVGTIEVKSGYGLNYEKEYELSQIIHQLKEHFGERIQIRNTYLAAHAVPKEYDHSSHYMNEVVIPLLKQLANEGILDAVDIFHEEGYFDQRDTELLFETAKTLHIPVKSHADEFYDNKGAILAAKYQALSTDHLLKTGQDGIEALADSMTVATLLPGTGFFLGKPQASARNFLDYGVKVAIASDYNPGSCHWNNLLQIASMAAPTYKMNQAELWCAITLNAAHALGLGRQGVLAEGFVPRFSIFHTESLDQVTYHWGQNFALSK